MRRLFKISICTRVDVLIALVAGCAGFAILASLSTIARTSSSEPRRVGAMLALTVVLQLFSVPVYGRGGIGVSAVGILATAFLLNTETAMAVAVVTALGHWAHRRRELKKAIFDSGNFVLAAGAAGATFSALNGAPQLLAACVGGCVFAVLNIGLVCLAMSLAEGIAFGSVWRERFHWARYYFLAFGPLALFAEIAYRRMGIEGLFAFALPPALMLLAFRHYLERTEEAVAEVRQANVRLRRAHRDTIAALSRSMEAKDLYTGGHTGRVSAVAIALAARLGFEGEALEAVEIGALLHDIGKIGIPEEILHKQGPLDDEEWVVMRTHPVVSDFILADLDLDPIVRQCARSSHERMDGRGYPDGLIGEDIPLPARIVFVADAFDAITSDRPYRRGRSIAAALAEIEANAGTQFCSSVVSALRELSQTSPDLLEPDNSLVGSTASKLRLAEAV